MYVYTSSTRTRRGGSCLRVILEVFLSTELASAVRRPGPCARALCEPVALLLSKNRTCARPRCNATPSKHFLHGSHFALHSSHPALHTSHLHFTLHSSSQLISSELFSSHFISSHMSLREEEWNPLVEWPPPRFFTNFDTQQAFTHSKLYTKTLLHRKFLNRELLHRDAFTRKAFTQRSFYTKKAFTHRKLLRTAIFFTRSVYTEDFL